MEIKHYNDLDPLHFEGDHVNGVDGRVLIGKEDGAKNFCMRLFELSPEGFTPKHSHEWEHEIFVYAGNGAVFREGDWVPLVTGNAVFIPGHEEHQIKNTGDTPFLFLCLIPSGPPEL